MNYHADVTFWNPFIQSGLNEDQILWDWTTRAIPVKKIRAKLIAKSGGIWVGSGLMEAVVLDSKKRRTPITAKALKKDGDLFKAKDVLATFEGSSDLILAYERTTINLAAFASGIATQTRKLVDLVSNHCKKHKIPIPRIAGTRKTLPHYRDLSVYSILCGNGYPHRVSLASGVLIKENHIRACGGITKAIHAARESAPHGLKIEIEVTSLSELKEAHKTQADIILLDNFTPSEILKATEWIRKQSYQPIIEVSGGLNEKNILDYTLPGVHILSVGGLTHSVRSCDFSLLIDPT
jgi:nicotinate-nucleotide pyrophosphorylase (carboxylating)